ncbi:hypothetical protein V1291_005054 [Nitrobacteraceae bacterium AZCC 1564]
MLDRLIQSANEGVERSVAVIRWREDLGEAGEGGIRLIAFEWLAAEADDPAIKILAPGSFAKSGRQMKSPPRCDAETRADICAGMRLLASADQGNLGEWRSEQVSADTAEPPVIFENEEVIDKAAMTNERLQFDVERRFAEGHIIAAHVSLSHPKIGNDPRLLHVLTITVPPRFSNNAMLRL